VEQEMGKAAFVQIVDHNRYGQMFGLLTAKVGEQEQDSRPLRYPPDYHNVAYH
jgi:hypothetical protein